MEVNGEMLPKPVQHALPLEVIQMAATAKHIYDNYKENKGSSDFEASLNAGLGSIGALAEQIPIINTGVEALGALSDPYEGTKLKEDIKRRFQPQILKETGVIGNKKGSLEMLKEKNADSHYLFKNDLEKSIGKKISMGQFNNYKNERDSKINDYTEKLYKNGINGKPYDQLTEEEQRDETSYLKTKATEETKKKLFGKEIKTSKEKSENKKLSQERHKLYQ